MKSAYQYLFHKIKKKARTKNSDLTKYLQKYLNKNKNGKKRLFS